MFASMVLASARPVLLALMVLAGVPSALFAACVDGDPCGAGGVCSAGVCVMPLDLTFVRLRASTPGRADGSLVVRATFATAPPADVLDASNGVGITVRDGLATEQDVLWAPADCTPTTRGGFLCLRPDVPRKLRFDPLRGTSSWRVTVRMKHLAMTGPFAAPVRARITTHGAYDRAGEAASCTSTPGALDCRQR